MSLIQRFNFSKPEFEKIKKYYYGSNWPVVYLIENSKEMYIGETAKLYTRSHQHYEKPERRKLNHIHIISDEEYNKSATLDIESFLIQYISADGKFILQNGNGGLQNHNYFDREKYKAKFEIIWKELQKKALVNNELIQIRNSDLFKYSPYKSLTNEQLNIVDSIFREIKEDYHKSFIIHGGPGTGKTILATYLVKALKEHKKTCNLKIGLVVPMGSLRRTLKKVFKNIKGLSANMVIGPSEVVSEYDILIVDEAHRLRRRKNIVNYSSFDNANKSLGLDKNSTELDWIFKSSKMQVLFYDENQSVRPSDVRMEDIFKNKFKEFKLNSQIRIGSGDDGDKYISFIQNIFDRLPVSKIKFDNYDLKLYENIGDMVNDIKFLNKKFDLCRLVAGYAWPWLSKNDSSKNDINIDGVELKWNSVNHDWVNSLNAINEVGCIHTVQGYDLNYIGLIIGPELSYDSVNKKFIIHKENYRDDNGHRGVDNIEELERYIINIYKTLLTRGIKGAYIYIVDKELREYFKKCFLEAGLPGSIRD